MDDCSNMPDRATAAARKALPEIEEILKGDIAQDIPFVAHLLKMARLELLCRLNKISDGEIESLCRLIRERGSQRPTLRVVSSADPCCD